jgi:hypothetical protein
MVCVPTEMALSDPPKSQSKINDGRRAACAVEDSGQGSHEKKTISISLTTLCVSIATTVGIASRNTVQDGEPCTKAGGIDGVGAWPMQVSENRSPRAGNRARARVDGL